MRILLSVAIIISAGIIYNNNVFAQKVVAKSESMRPDWLANSTPTPGNNSFEFQITEVENPTLENARHSSLVNLTTYIQQRQNIATTIHSDISKSEDNGKFSEQENYNFTFVVEGEKVSFNSRKYDEYWEHIQYSDGRRVYRLYTLFGVAKGTKKSNFDNLTFTRKYGARGFVRSLIPGCGQIYKGSVVKGSCIIGGEVLLIGGIIFTESQRSSYEKKMKEDPKHLKEYNNEADNWGNARNICIGGAAALYVYNLIDALFANGRKRTVSKPGEVHLSFNPAIDNKLGMSVALNF